MRPLEVLLATTSFPSDAADWKGRFIYDMADALAAREDLEIAIWGPPGDLPEGVTSALQYDDATWLSYLMAAGGLAHQLRRSRPAGLLNAARLLRRLRRACRLTACDLYHVNWLQLLLGIPEDGRPAYVTVLGTDFALLGLPGMAVALRRALVRRPVTLAPNAAWMVPRLQALFGEVASVQANPFGVAPRWFTLERQPPTPPVWLVVSRITSAKIGDLVNWGEGLFGASRRLLLFGPMQEAVSLPEWIDYRGPTDPDALATDWYPRATGLLTLSRHDEGRPQVMIEAMASGMPIVASDIAAHADLIFNNDTGWLVSDPKSLAQALRRAEQETAADGSALHRRAWIRDHVGTWADYASRCRAQYTELLNREAGDVR